MGPQDDHEVKTWEFSRGNGIRTSGFPFNCLSLVSSKVCSCSSTYSRNLPRRLLIYESNKSGRHQYKEGMYPSILVAQVAGFEVLVQGRFSPTFISHEVPDQHYFQGLVTPYIGIRAWNSSMIIYNTSKVQYCPGGTLNRTLARALKVSKGTLVRLGSF